MNPPRLAETVYRSLARLTTRWPHDTMRTVAMRTVSRDLPASPEQGSARHIVTVAFLALCVAILMFFRVGYWLVREDPLEKASAIVILSGGMPERALQAVEIYRAGYAPEVWITQAAQPKEEMRALGIPFDGEEEYSRRILIHEGVPESAIRILTQPIVNTADEVRVIAAALGAHSDAKIIVVTTKAHTRRVHTLWLKLAAGHGQSIVRAAGADSFEPGHWWHSTRDALDVVRELLGLLNVWSGLPLQPAR
jgi:uncharacterized SAM-binding protein YcdF (DUF218 family)